MQVFKPLSVTGSIQIHDENGDELHNADIYTRIVVRHSQQTHLATARRMLTTALDAYLMRHQNETLQRMRDTLHDLLESKARRCDGSSTQYSQRTPASDTDATHKFKTVVSGSRQYVTDNACAQMGALAIDLPDCMLVTKLPAACVSLQLDTGDTLNLLVFGAPLPLATLKNVQDTASHMHALHFFTAISDDKCEIQSVHERDSACGAFRSTHQLGKTPSNHKFESMAQGMHDNARTKLLGRSVQSCSTSREKSVCVCNSYCNGARLASVFFKLY